MPELEGEIEITLKWKNEEFFEMTAKPNDGDATIVLRMDENTYLPALWSDVTKICSGYFKKIMEQIGNEMKQEGG